MESPGLSSGSGLTRICGTLYNPDSQRCQIKCPRVVSHSEELIRSSREEQQMAVVETERFWLAVYGLHCYGFEEFLKNLKSLFDYLYSFHRYHSYYNPVYCILHE